MKSDRAILLEISSTINTFILIIFFRKHIMNQLNEIKKISSQGPLERVEKSEEEEM